MATNRKPREIGPNDVAALTQDAPRITRRMDAYEFLSELVKVIHEEPKRLNMGNWLKTRFNEMEPKPVCGTVACIGGWTVAMLRPKGITTAAFVIEGVNSRAGSYAVTASQVLGMTTRQTEHLFHPHVRAMTIGSAEYVEAVVKRIRNFQSNHRRQLHAKMVSPGSVRALRNG